jgi:hypothetical protein
MNNDEKSMSLVWICTGNESLSKVSILDTAAVGEVLETFAVCSSPIICIGAVPSFNDKDPDVLSSQLYYDNHHQMMVLIFVRFVY